MSTDETYLWPHERLDAWRIARQARVVALRFTESLPPGHGDEVRQIKKATASVVRNIGEGANRFHPGDKVHKFEIAAGEAGEAVSAVVSLQDCGLGDPALAEQFFRLQARVGAMLTGLVHKHRR